MRKTKCIRLFALILTVAMMCTAMSMAVFAEPGDEGNGQTTTTVEYYDENGFVRSRICTVVTESLVNSNELILEDGWYVVDDSIYRSVNSRIHVLGDVHLVLLEQGSSFDISAGIRVPNGNSLSIYSAVEGNNREMIRFPQVMLDEGCAVLGGNANETCGDINIYGVDIILIALEGAAIGNGKKAEGSESGSFRMMAGTLSLNGNFADGKPINMIPERIIVGPGMYMSSDETSIGPCNHQDSDADGICELCLSPVDISVTFDTNGGTAIDPQVVDFNGTATKPEDPVKNGSTFAGWYCDGETYDFRSQVRTDRTIEARWVDGAVAYAQSATVIYEGGLKLRFTLKFSDALLDDANAYVKFSKNGEELKVYTVASEADASGVAQYEFPIEAPDWMDEVQVEVYDGSENKVVFRNPDGEEYTDDVHKYSVYQHCQNTDDYSEGYRNLVENGLYYYCANAQKYFGHNADALDGKDITPPAVTVDDGYKMTTSGTRPSWLTSTSLRVNFLDYNTLRVTFVLPESDISNYSFKLVDSEGTTVTTSPRRLGSGRYALDAEDISAPNLANAYTFTVTNNSTQESYTITASCMSYAIMSMQKGTTQEMRDLGQAFYLYGLYAEAYFGGH